ncbi:MAG: DUF4249 family protein [Bacteroidetes bacterium]|nr:DUF4249 family protein [Bacteroidota bacterium]
MKDKSCSTYRHLFKLFQCLILALIVTSCTKIADIKLPAKSEQVVVEGSIENDAPPIIILTKSQRFFGTVNLNDLGSYFIHGAEVRVRSGEGDSVLLQEFCLNSLNLPADQARLLLRAFGFSQVDSASLPSVCVYTVPDIFNYLSGGMTAFHGKERTDYFLNITAPPFNGGDSIRLSSSTHIPTAIGIDSLAIREHENPIYRDSLAAVYVYITVPDTFGNFVRYKNSRNSEPYYSPLTGSVYDDKLFVGLQIGLPLGRGEAPGSKFDLNTSNYFWKGDTVNLKWSNIDSRTYDFYFSLENSGGSSPFSSPVRINTNINNGLGVWAGYATKYYSIIVPK